MTRITIGDLKMIVPEQDGDSSSKNRPVVRFLKDGKKYRFIRITSPYKNEANVFTYISKLSNNNPLIAPFRYFYYNPDDSVIFGLIDDFQYTLRDIIKLKPRVNALSFNYTTHHRILFDLAWVYQYLEKNSIQCDIISSNQVLFYTIDGQINSPVSSIKVLINDYQYASSKESRMKEYGKIAEGFAKSFDPHLTRLNCEVHNVMNSMIWYNKYIPFSEIITNLQKDLYFPGSCDRNELEAHFKDIIEQEELLKDPFDLKDFLNSDVDCVYDFEDQCNNNIDFMMTSSDDIFVFFFFFVYCHSPRIDYIEKIRNRLYYGVNYEEIEKTSHKITDNYREIFSVFYSITDKEVLHLFEFAWDKCFSCVKYSDLLSIALESVITLDTDHIETLGRLIFIFCSRNYDFDMINKINDYLKSAFLGDFAYLNEWFPDFSGYFLLIPDYNRISIFVDQNLLNKSPINAMSSLLVNKGSNMDYFKGIHHDFSSIDHDSCFKYLLDLFFSLNNKSFETEWIKLLQNDESIFSSFIKYLSSILLMNSNIYLFVIRNSSSIFKRLDGDTLQFLKLVLETLIYAQHDTPHAKYIFDDALVSVKGFGVKALEQIDSFRKLYDFEENDKQTLIEIIVVLFRDYNIKMSSNLVDSMHKVFNNSMLIIKFRNIYFQYFDKCINNLFDLERLFANDIRYFNNESLEIRIQLLSMYIEFLPKHSNYEHFSILNSEFANRVISDLNNSYDPNLQDRFDMFIDGMSSLTSLDNSSLPFNVFHIMASRIEHYWSKFLSMVNGCFPNINNDVYMFSIDTMLDYIKKCFEHKVDFPMDESFNLYLSYLSNNHRLLLSYSWNEHNDFISSFLWIYQISNNPNINECLFNVFFAILPILNNNTKELLLEEILKLMDEPNCTKYDLLLILLIEVLSSNGFKDNSKKLISQYIRLGYQSQYDLTMLYQFLNRKVSIKPNKICSFIVREFINDMNFEKHDEVHLVQEVTRKEISKYNSELYQSIIKYDENSNWIPMLVSMFNYLAVTLNEEESYYEYDQ